METMVLLLFHISMYPNRTHPNPFTLLVSGKKQVPQAVCISR